MGIEASKRQTRRGDAEIAAAIRGDEIDLHYSIRNKDRAIGAALSGAIALEYGTMPPLGTARLRFEVFATPVGTQRCDVRYHDGSRTAWLVSDWADPTEDEPAFGAPEMHVSMSFRNYLKMRSGQATALEAIEDGGSVDARWTLLLLLHGMIQSPEYVAAYRGLPVLPDELGWWGEVAPHIPPAED